MSIMSRLKELFSNKPKVHHRLYLYTAGYVYIHSVGSYECVQYSDGRLIVRRGNVCLSGSKGIRLRDPNISYGLDGRMTLNLDNALTAMGLSLISLYEYHSILANKQIEYRDNLESAGNRWGITKN